MTHASRSGRWHAGRAPSAESSPGASGAPTAADRRRRRRRRHGFALIAVLVALVSAGVVTTSVITGLPSWSGANTPQQAVDGFLAAIYDTHDARAAGRFVCESARDNTELDRIVQRVSRQVDAYPGARTTWTYPPIQTEGRSAAAEVTLTMTTPNEQVASRVVTLLLVDDGGWWVCDVRAE